MKLEVFEALIVALDKQSKKSYELAQFGVDLMDYEEGWLAPISLLINVYYGKIGSDWISWYLYERNMDSSKDAATDGTGEPICFDIPSLWKYVENIRVSDDFIEFTFPEKTTITASDIRAFFASKL